jgi:hypothetical protein
MEHPKAVGDRCTLAVMMALQARGMPFSVPFGENTRYDLVIDEGHRLARVQCKSGRLRNGAVYFATCSCYQHQRPRSGRRAYHGAIEYFAVHCPATAAVYLVPIADVPAITQAALRVEPARNNQRFGIRLAQNYEIARVAYAPTEEPAASAGAG